ncbi:MAG: septum formation family protein [Marmoricola sp.]
MSRSRIVLAVVALVALAGLVAPASAVSPRAAAAPVTGRCYNLSFTQIYPMSSSVASVPCSDKHTTKTYYVKNVPTNVDYKNITAAAMAKVGFGTCEPKFETTLGSTPENRHLTAYDFIFFAPTAAQRAAGARWVRCDLILAGGKSLRALTTDTVPVIQGEITDATKRCLVTTDHLYTTCAGVHSYRSSAAYTLPGTLYRTNAQFVAKGEQLCPTAEYFTWPGKLGWDIGDHVLVCYDRTAS